MPDPAVRRRIRRLAGYYGHKRLETYLQRIVGHSVWSDEREMIVDPRTGQAVGTDRFWQKLKTLLLRHCKQTGDPLDHPGFLARWRELQGSERGLPFVEEDYRAEPDRKLARVAV